MTEYNKFIEWTKEDREGLGECPVPDGTDVTVWLEGGDIYRDKSPQGWGWGDSGTYITAYLIHKPEPAPCPFCGGEASALGRDDGAVEPHVMCQEPTCRATGPYRETEAKAIKAWNKDANK